MREVTLIGQNVNSYQGGIGFAQLLLRIAEVPGIERVRFTTSHPHDLSDELIEAFRTQPKIAPHFHLPVQSGSDRVLKRMRRDYTVAQYLERLEKLRAARPGIAVTTDIIVGFPGETEEDFELTLELTEQVRYDNQFSFIYSPAPQDRRRAAREGLGPRAARGEDRSASSGCRSSSGRSAAEIDARAGRAHEVEVLVEGHSQVRRRASASAARRENRTVNFDGDAPAGAIVKVLVDERHAQPAHGQADGGGRPDRTPPPSETLAGVRPDRFPLSMA